MAYTSTDRYDEYLDSLPKCPDCGHILKRDETGSYCESEECNG